LTIDLQQEWKGLQNRLVDLIRSENKSDLGDEVMELDPRVYTDTSRFAAERSRIFGEEPLLVALSGELSTPGDRVLFDEAGPPVLVVRGEDGRLRAFLNMCTHRGARLVSSCDPARRLLCPFHGWTFDLEGRVVSIPLAQAFEGVDRAGRALVRIPVAERHGMVFVRPRPVEPAASGMPAESGAPGEEEIDLIEFLGPIGPLLEALELGSLRRIQADRLEVRANWKLALDMGRENYHVPAVHKSTLSPNLYPHVTAFDVYGPHSRFSGASRDFANLLGKPESEWPAMSYQAVHYLFPNTTLSFTHAVDGRTPVVTMSRVFPGEAIGQAVTLIATYRRGAADDAADAQVRAMHEAVVQIVGSEDYGVARKVWQSLEHGAPALPFVLGRNELLVQRYHRELATRIGMPLP
jgi:nitrite reductase/ring-hydroxylating ferredoxin subunit